MDKPRNLAEASQYEIEAFFASFDTVFLDFDGVIMLGSNTIPGVSESIKCIKSRGKQMKIITNNCYHSILQWEKMLKKCDIDFKTEDVIYPMRVLIPYLKSINFNKKVFLLGSDAMIEEFTNAGIEVSHFGEHPRIVGYQDALQYIKDDLDVGAVIVDFDCNLTTSKLQKAVSCLSRSDVMLIYCATDKMHLINNIKVIGPKFIQDAISTVSGRTPVVIGKPSLVLRDYVEKHVELKPERTLFIGDSLSSDMTFAANCGYQKLLVLTGVTKIEDIATCEPEIRPNFYLESLGNLHKLLN